MSKKAMKKTLVVFSLIALLTASGCSFKEGDVVSQQQAPNPPPQNILFISNADGDHEIYLVKTPGDGPTQLTHNDRDDISASWGPGGTKILFCSMRTGNADVYIMNADGSDQRPLTTHPGYDAQPQWSPDGQHIVFVSNRHGVEDIYMLTLADNSLKRLSESEAGAINPQWSPDGRSIVYLERTLGSKGTNLVLADLDGNTLRRLSDSKKIIDIQVGWAPDSRNMVVASKRGKTIDLYKIDVDGESTLQLTKSDGSEAYPVYSPDGGKILFLSQDGDGIRQELYVMKADGSERRKIFNTTGVEYSNPSWSADGKWILFSRFENQHFKAFIGLADGSELKALSNDTGFQFQPRVAPL